MKRAAPEDYDEEPPLFASKPPPHNGTKTSIAAAASVADKAATQRAAVLRCIASSSSAMTREEIERHMNLPGNAVRPRVWELLGKNGHPVKIRESGERRRTLSGRFAEVLVIA